MGSAGLAWRPGRASQAELSRDCDHPVGRAGTASVAGWRPVRVAPPGAAATGGRRPTAPSPGTSAVWSACGCSPERWSGPPRRQHIPQRSGLPSDRNRTRPASETVTSETEAVNAGIQRPWPPDMDTLVCGFIHRSYMGVVRVVIHLFTSPVSNSVVIRYSRRKCHLKHCGQSPAALAGPTEAIRQRHLSEVCAVGLPTVHVTGERAPRSVWPFLVRRILQRRRVTAAVFRQCRFRGSASGSSLLSVFRGSASGSSLLYVTPLRLSWCSDRRRGTWFDLEGHERN